MPDSGSRQLLDRVSRGDEQAATEIFDRYFSRLVALARRRLSPKLARRLDPEDVVQSAYRSFFRLARADRCQLGQDEQLWHLLAAITVNKARKSARRHQARKRSVELEQSTARSAVAFPIPPEAVARDPTPVEAALLAEEIEHMVDKTVRLWDVITGDCRAVLEGHLGPVYCVAFSPSGTMLASGSGDTTVRLWDLVTRRADPKPRSHAGEVVSLAFSRTAVGATQMLASGGADGTIKLWYLGSDREPEMLTGHQSSVTSVAFSRDGLTLASASEDNTIRLWRRATEAEVESTNWQRAR